MEDCNIFDFVPMQDFSHSWTDKDLYEKYDLSPGEVCRVDDKADGGREGRIDGVGFDERVIR